MPLIVSEVVIVGKGKVVRSGSDTILNLPELLMSVVPLYHLTSKGPVPVAVTLKLTFEPSQSVCLTAG